MSTPYIKFFLWSFVMISPSLLAAEYNVCMGENIETHLNRCLPHDAFASCEELQAKAKELCQASGSSAEPTIITLRSVSGGKCGYTNVKVVCQ